MNKKPHLNLQPSANWGIPFGIAVVISMAAALTFYESPELRLSSYTVGKNCASAFFTAFQITILTGFWVAFRGSNRRFYQYMRLRVSIVGSLCPAVIICIWLFIEYIGYGAPTLASPGVEILLTTSAVLGELLVRFASHPAHSLLENPC